MKQKSKGRKGKIKINLWIPEELHAKVRLVVERETIAGRKTSISKIYEASIRAYIGQILGG